MYAGAGWIVSDSLNVHDMFLATSFNRALPDLSTTLTAVG